MKNFHEVSPEIRRMLNQLREKHRIPHCLLFTGGSAKERADAAEYTAAVLQCPEENAPCGKCRACAKILSGHHPDVFRIETGGKSETVRLEDVRQVTQTGYIVPNEGFAKVYIFPDAGRIRTEGQNALLKIIEEPPSHAYVILCCETRSLLLPTVLSRSYEISLGDAPEAAVSSRTEKKVNDICSGVCQALAQKDEYGVMTALAPLDKDRNGAALCAGKMMLIVRDALIGMGYSSGLPDAVKQLAGACSPAVLTAMSGVLEEISDAAERNANVNLLLALFSSRLTDCL